MTYNVTFDKLPLTLSEMTAMPEALLEKPEDTVALTVAALDACSRDLEEGCRMLDYLRGPRPLSNAEKQFIRERFSYGGCRKVPLSYFRGAVPANDYVPEKPFTLEIRDSSSQIADEGFFKYDLVSGGADTARPVMLRYKPSAGKYYLWEEHLLVQIRTPVSEDPWA